MSETKQQNQPNEFQIMDHKDEMQIANELTGETTLIEEYVYSFEMYDKEKKRNRQVTGLSYAGIKEMVRRRGNFEIISTEKEETPETIRVIVKIRDLINRVDFLGASEAEKTKPFAYVLAVNKAERNAYRKAMPAEFLAKMVDAFLHGKTEVKTETPRAETPIPRQLQPNVPQQPQPQQEPLKLASPMDVEAQFPDDLRENLDFRFADDRMLIKPRCVLGSELFAKTMSVVRGIGGEYISQGRDSHFEVPLQ